MKTILKQAYWKPLRIKSWEWAWFLAFLLILVAAPQVFAEETASTHPKQVTVYPNGARVTREGTLKLSAGDQQVVFPDLPASLIETSLHLSVEGPAGTKLYGVSMRKEYTPQVVEGRTQRIKNRIQELEDQKTDLADRVQTRQTEITMLKNMVEGHTQHDKTPPQSGTEITQSAETVAKRIAFLTAQNRKDERTSRELGFKITALQNELSQGGSVAREKRAAQADLNLASAGTLRFTLTYQVSGASWTPKYDLRLETDGEKPRLDLGFNADVKQSTGEDWKDVALTLSTARPTEGTQIPDPTNWWLDYFNAQILRYQREQAYLPSAPPAPVMSKSTAAMYLAGKDEEMEPAEVAMAKTIESSYAMKFAIPSHHDIPADGSDHQVGIVQDSHPVDLTLVTVPKLSPAVFLQAKITYDGEQILPPGPAQLFRDDEFVGTTSLSSKAPGESFDLGFGQDDQVRVERKMVEEKSGKEGGFFSSSKGERQYRWVTTLANYHTGIRTVEVEEQLPRPREKDIQVESTELLPKPEAENLDKPGLVTWKLELKPKEKTKITFAYKVKYPAGVQVSGLE